MKLAKIICVMVAFVFVSCGNHSIPKTFTDVQKDANIFPDYKNVVIPPNIAPMNFMVRENADNYAVKLLAAGKEIDAFADKYGKFDFPEKKWKEMLVAAKGEKIVVSVFAERDGKWEKYNDFNLLVAEEPIDPYVSYRLIEPGYELYRQLGLYQRDVTSFNVHVIYENNRSFEKNNNHCVNCHNYQNYSTKSMMFHIRGNHGGTMIVRNGKLEKMNMKTDSILSSTVYPSWHPNKPWIVFSSNKTGQTFHMLDRQKIEVVDMSSDLVFYDAERKVLRNILKTEDHQETFPCWSPDGKTVFFCDLYIPDYKSVPDSVRSYYVTDRYNLLRYNIMSMAFDERSQTFGSPQMTLNCASFGKSATVPRVSPDGKYLLFTLGDYGQFHIWHRSADLYVMNLQTREFYPLQEANSKDAESYHSWSSNGRWIVFTSRRDDGSYTRLYITYFDKNGKAHKAFMLPQRDPEQNTLLLKSYNVPEMTKDAVGPSASDFKKVIYKTNGTPVGFESKPNSKNLYYYKPQVK